MISAILISKDVYVGPGLYSKNYLSTHFLNSAKLHQKNTCATLFYPALLCFNTSYKNSLVLTLVLILLGCFLNPIHMMTTENHWMVVIFFLEICKTEIFLLVFIDVTSKTLSCYMFLIFSFCVYYKVVSIWKQIKR